MKLIKFLKIGSLSILLITLSGCGGGDSLNTKDSALQVLVAFNANKTTAPSLEVYKDAGIAGVTVKNINAVNELVLKLNATNFNGNLLSSGAEEKIRAEIAKYLSGTIVPNGDTNTTTGGTDTNTSVPTDSNTTTGGTDTNTTVQDTVKPIITLNGADVNLSVGDTYTDAGATASDDVDGDITASIVTTNTVDTTKAGTYTISYAVSDAATNAAVPVSRTVTVVAVVIVDTVKPVITLNGADVNLNVGDTYTDAGATASDDVDGDITASIVTTNTVDTTKAGTYTISYAVSDAATNAADTVTRTVTVTAVNTTAKREIWFAFKDKTETFDINGTKVNKLKTNTGSSSLVDSNGTSVSGLVLEVSDDFEGFNGSGSTPPPKADDIVPFELLRTGSWFVGEFDVNDDKTNDMSGTLTFKGLTPNANYDVKLGAVRKLDDNSVTQEAARTGDYTVNGVKQQFNADDANNRELTFSNVKVTGNGEIVLIVSTSDHTTALDFAYLGWLKLIEK